MVTSLNHDACTKLTAMGKYIAAPVNLWQEVMKVGKVELKLSINLHPKMKFISISIKD